jgi:hypothetical protein
VGSEVRVYIEAGLKRLIICVAADQLALTLSSGVLGALGPEEKSIVVSPLFALGTYDH